MANSDIDLTQGTTRRAIGCATCGHNVMVTPDWRDLMRAADSTPDDWDGIMRCHDGHPDEPMHGIEGIEHDEEHHRYRSVCWCTEASPWSTDKEPAYTWMGKHLAPVMQAMTDRDTPARPDRPVLGRFICVHAQFGTGPCMEGCHRGLLTRTADGWQSR